VAGYGKAKGEYVVGCHTFGRDEGVEGYFLITAHIILNHGYIIPLTTRYLALEGSVPVSPLLRHILRALVEYLRSTLPALDWNDRMAIYENRDQLYLSILGQPEACYELIETAIMEWLNLHEASPELLSQVSKTLQLDQAFCPRYGEKIRCNRQFDFNVDGVIEALDAMDLPAPANFSRYSQHKSIEVPGGAGVFLKGPDGGSWMRGRLVEEVETEQRIAVQ
jgi:hypothetical protein